MQQRQFKWNLDITKGKGTDKIYVFAITRFCYTRALFHIFYFFKNSYGTLQFPSFHWFRGNDIDHK